MALLRGVRICFIARRFKHRNATEDMICFRSKVIQSSSAHLARYGGRQTVSYLVGDGIGPEMLEHIQRIFTFARVPVDFETIHIGPSEKDLDNAIVSIRRNGVALKGNIETKFDDPTFISRNLEIRRRLDLYANVIHAMTIPTLASRHKGIDIVMVRENTEGEYSGLEHESVKGVVESLKIVTKVKMERISRYAFDFAMRYDRKKVTAVHKANIQKLGDGLFLRVASEIAKQEYPQIEFTSMIVDNASMQLVSRPQQFSGGIMLMPNLYGNIISNIACGLVGGPGLVSGMNFGAHYAVFETATRNTGTTLTGKDVANPTSFIRAACDMLRFLGYNEYSDLLCDALYETLTVQRVHTRDIGGDAAASKLVTTMLENVEKILETNKFYPRSHK